MKKTLKMLLIAAMMTMMLGGCEKKEKDVATQQVLKISITPTPEIIPEPKQINPAAIVTKDNVTAVNLYLLDHPEAVPPITVTPTVAAESNNENMSDESENASDEEQSDSYDDYEESDDDYSDYSDEDYE